MPATQTERPFRLKTPIGDDALLLESFAGIETVSSPFRYVLRLLYDTANLTFSDILNKPAVLTFAATEDGRSERCVHGLISRARLLELGTDGRYLYEAEMVPWLWLLTLFSNCRIFQNQSVPDIVEKVFKDRGFSDFRSDLKGNYAEREYCVQYRETDFNFVSRLLEEEGIFYYFEHTVEKHTLVLADSRTAVKPCPEQSTVRYQPATGGVLAEDTIGSLEQENRIITGSIALTDYDFEKPTTSLLASMGGDAVGEDYDFPGKYKTKADGDRYARIRLEEKEVQLITVRGHSNATSMCSGYKFDLTEHPRDEANTAYTVIRVEHSGRNTSYRSGGFDAYEYSNQFEAIPNRVEFRPPRLARKPVVNGAQTAVVVGKSGEEIWTDKYGRVKVHFFWDRLGSHNENESCWIRVSHSWAGEKWGAICLPRIGQEVIVSFIEGDPDRPIITGRVYNAVQTPPYTLPGDQTKTTMKTVSSKGSAGYNEIRIEDKADSEQIYIHSAKDLEIRAEHDRHEWVKQDRHLIVKRDRVEKIERDAQVEVDRDYVRKSGRDEHVTIQGKQVAKITGDQSVDVSGNVIESVKGSHSEDVTGSLYLKAMQIVLEASTGITLKVGGNFITINPAGVAVSGTMIMLNSGGAALSGTPGNLLTPTAPVAAQEPATGEGGSQSTPSGPQGAIKTAHAEDITDTRSTRSTTPDVPTHNPNSPENKKKKDWIAIELKDEKGRPVGGERYRVTLPDGTVDEGTLDSEGKARIQGIDPGSCKITFPDRDKDAWEPS